MWYTRDIPWKLFRFCIESFSNYFQFPPLYITTSSCKMSCKYTRDSLHLVYFLSIKHLYCIFINTFFMCRWSENNSHSTASHDERKTYLVALSDQRVMTRRQSEWILTHTVKALELPIDTELHLNSAIIMIALNFMLHFFYPIDCADNILQCRSYRLARLAATQWIMETLKFFDIKNNFTCFFYQFLGFETALCVGKLNTKNKIVSQYRNRENQHRKVK